MEKNRIHFYISGEKNEVSPGSILWGMPLSGKRAAESGGALSTSGKKENSISVGDYLSAAAETLSKNSWAMLVDGIKKTPGYSRPVSEEAIFQVLIFLEKHGAFYHPLKICVELEHSQKLIFVLNGAVSAPGLLLIQKEYSLISKLNGQYPGGYLPEVMGIDFSEINGNRTGFFLGQWFDGYNEFHISELGGKRQIVIWESDGSCRHLPMNKALAIYREAARILTHYYDIERFQQIFPWHHAAGDFIVKLVGGKVHVRLITVRGYCDLTEWGSGSDGEEQKKYILPSLFLFFLNMTLRMRLDRLDGTGETQLLPDEVVFAAAEGFFDELDKKSGQYRFGDLKQAFCRFALGFNPDQWMSIMIRLIESGDTSHIETQLLIDHLETHAQMIQTIFKTV